MCSSKPIPVEEYVDELRRKFVLNFLQTSNVPGKKMKLQNPETRLQTLSAQVPYKVLINYLQAYTCDSTKEKTDFNRLNYLRSCT